jgi:hypothetical protein
LNPQGASAESVPGDARELYRRLAPATVFVHTAHAYGTGVVLDTEGHILTNNHVVGDAEDVDFHRRARVEFGHLGPDGVMTILPDAQEAWVVRLDPSRDLAVLKVDHLPEGITPVRIAAQEPAPGEPVVCMGHGSVGLAWAIRSCEVQAIGRLSLSLGVLLGECDGADANTEDCRERRRRWEQDYPGLVVQSSCSLSPGDSGGPLVNRAGELVGLNVQIIDAGAEGYPRQGIARASIHIHLRELRAVLENLPSQRLAVLPDPWILRGSREGADQDLDGRMDTILCEADDGDGYAELRDLDGSVPDFRASEVDGFFAGRRFDAEFAFVRHGRERFFLYDTDDNGSFDLLFRAAGNSGRVEAAWRVGADGEPRAAHEFDGGATMRTDVLPAAQRERAGRYLLERNPDDPIGPIPAILRTAERGDVDHDEANDHLFANRGPFVALLADADQDTLGTLNGEALEHSVQDHRVDAEATLVADRAHEALWAWYDRDGDGRQELALAADWSSWIVHRALLFAADGTSQEVPGYLGTLAARPDLAHAGNDRLRRISGGGLRGLRPRDRRDGRSGGPASPDHPPRLPDRRALPWGPRLA